MGRRTSPLEKPHVWELMSCDAVRGRKVANVRASGTAMSCNAETAMWPGMDLGQECSWGRDGGTQKTC
jgi:hypothetical protein